MNRQLLSIGLILTLSFSTQCKSSELRLSFTEVQDNPPIYVLQPFDDLSKAVYIEIYNRLKTLYPKVSLASPIPLPKEAYYSKRKRYRAEKLLVHLLSKAGDGQVIFGLSSKDISTTKGVYEDWGIMGLAYCPGRAGVASTFRLDKIKLYEQFFKVVIHELGHTQGLNHCDVSYCFMHDAEGKNRTDLETDFCPSCKAVLKSNGWLY